MTGGIKSVESLNFEGNVCENWRRFKRNYGIFMIAKDIDEKQDLVKTKTFLFAVGKCTIELFDSFNLTAKERTSYVSVIRSFEAPKIQV